LVHGLDGNSIDTFVYDSDEKKSLPILWPRDLLPQLPEFKSTRIMTYAYNADLFDGNDVSEMQDWYGNLLGALGQLADIDKVSCIY
jgi:hypothetical protein